MYNGHKRGVQLLIMKLTKSEFLVAMDVLEFQRDDDKDFLKSNPEASDVVGRLAELEIAIQKLWSMESEVTE